MLFQSNNVIIRYLRFRLGDTNGIKSDSMDINYASDVIMDHCSISWGVDESVSIYDNSNVTIQWSLITEGLNNVNHSCGGLWGPGSSYHHNLFAHNKTRNPKLAYLSDKPADFRNNVLYNWGEMSVYTGSQGYLNLVNNYYKPGLSTKNSVRTTIVEPDSSGTNSLYVAGNYMVGSQEVTSDNWIGVTDIANQSLTPYEVPYVTTHSAENAYHVVLAEAGASLVRDEVDSRVINDVLTGSGMIINSQDDVGGYPVLETTESPVDSDHDGMPDYWEILHGLNPNETSDRNDDLLGDGYTNLEKYINSLTLNGQHKPIVYYNGPKANTIFGSKESITISADAYDVDGNITKVEFYDGDTLISQKTSKPYSITLKHNEDSTYYLKIKAYDNSGLHTETEVVPIHVNLEEKTLPWVGQDIGSTAIQGFSSIKKDVITVKGSGDIGGSKDSFYYLFQKVNEDGGIISRLDENTLINDKSYAGIMLRDNLEADSAMVILAVSNSKENPLEINFMIRAEDGGMVTSTTMKLVSFPVYLKLDRQGDTISAYQSKDKNTWLPVATNEVSMNESLYIGLVSTAQENANGTPNYNTARFSNTSLYGIIPPVIFMDQKDAITSNMSFEITGSANRKAMVATIVNGEEISRDKIKNDLKYSEKINLSEGENNIIVRAYLTQILVHGRVVAEIPADALLKLDNTNQKVKKGINKIKLRSESDGTIEDLEFMINDIEDKKEFPVEVVSDDNLSFAFYFNLELGDNRIQLNATDAAGNVSESVNITIELVDNTPPVIECSETIAQHDAFALDVDDDLSGVKECTITMGGKTYNYNEIANSILPVGQYDATITAIDNAGNSTTISCTVTVQVYVYTLDEVINKADALGMINSPEAKASLMSKAVLIGQNKYRVEQIIADLDNLKSDIEKFNNDIDAEFARMMLGNIEYLLELYTSGKVWDAIYETNLKYDFGNGNLASGYTSIKTTTLYTQELGYGLVGEKFNHRNRKGPDDLLRDFVFSEYKADNKWYYQFWADLPNGTYTITLITGDRDAEQASFDVKAENDIKLQSVGSAKNVFTEKSFEVSVTDGQLNIEFIGNNITRINALDIVPHN